ncbi:hypothetical protein ACIA78_21860 [Streptomyces xanthochromogenes]
MPSKGGGLGRARSPRTFSGFVDATCGDMVTVRLDWDIAERWAR